MKYARLMLGMVATLSFASAAGAQVMQQPRTANSPTVRAAVRASTDCIAQAALQDPAGALAAQQSRGWDLIQIAYQRCRTELGRMIQAHDGLYGPDTGFVFAKGPYAADLPRAVLTRIQPELARRAEEAARAEAAQRAEASRQQAHAKQIEGERKKLIAEANDEHYACIRAAMLDLVPYSSEAADTVAIAVMAKCAEHEKKRARLAAALFDLPSTAVAPVVAEHTETMRKSVISEIVTFRAERAKASIGSQRPSDGAPATAPAGKTY